MASTRVTRTPGICGGVACIAGTRIMVWLLVSYRNAGVSDSDLLEYYPGLQLQNLSAAWEYYRLHSEEIDRTIHEYEELNRKGLEGLADE